MNDADKTFLFELLNTPSPSGFEAQGLRRWAAYVRQYADTVESDTYGNTWATLTGTAGEGAPKVMLEAHADEIGFIINYISDDGFLYFAQIGGSDRAIVRSRRVRILGSRGVVKGVIGNTAIHLRKDKSDEKLPEWHEFFIDVGATSKQQVADLGIRVGHPVVFEESADELTANRLIGRALDNRIGGFIIAQVMKRLAEAPERPGCTVYAVNAIQEEIGGHGARMITYRLSPDVAVVLDVTHATDSPGISKERFGSVKLGGGPSVTHGTANHPKVVDRLVETAGREEIPLQHEASSRVTGTDTDDVFVTKAGVPVALLSLPMRYMHSTVEMVDLQDVERCIQLLTAFVRSVQPGDSFRTEI